MGRMERADVAVVGAGAAGLAAAHELRRRGLSVTVLEARDRIGGRILTVHDPRLPLPVELGAEFVHGAAPVTRRLLAAAGIATIDIAGEHWRAHRGRVARTDSWGPVGRILRHIDGDALRGPSGRGVRSGRDAPDVRNLREAGDRSFDSFLAGLGSSVPAADRRAALEFVQGYHAADPAELSVRSLAPTGSAGEEGASGAALGLARVLGGYDQLPRWLAAELAAELRLRSPVAAIEWRRGHVELTVRRDGGATERLTARAAVVTVPAGVLAARPEEPGGLRLAPDPPAIRRALDRVAMGAALRLVCWFHSFPWSAGAAEADPGRTAHASFWRLDGPTFPVWWTAYPLRWPLAVAWCGGPRAAALVRRGARAIESIALGELAASFGLPRRTVTARRAAAWMHDWVHDVHARGAYSYARVGGAGAARRLARPVEGTLFFAGEATDTSGHTGTVEGALASGLRAARQVERALGT